MPKKLAIFVSSDEHLDKIIGLCRAAQRKGIAVSIFFSHLGTLLTQDPRFQELGGLAKLSVCEVGFKSHGLQPPVPGLAEKDYATQARHGEIIAECDRYISF